MGYEPKYPGELASSIEIFALAEEYKKAAHALQALGVRGKPLTRAPMRLAAIHAIELYLNALLLNQGYDPAEVRGLQHNLQRRTELAVFCGLKLRVKTMDHIKTMGRTREYLIMRYGPELASTASQINRLQATLEEVSTKVSGLLETKAAATSHNELGGNKRSQAS